MVHLAELLVEQDEDQVGEPTRSKPKNKAWTGLRNRPKSKGRNRPTGMLKRLRSWVVIVTVRLTYHHKRLRSITVVVLLWPIPLPLGMVGLPT